MIFCGLLSACDSDELSSAPSQAVLEGYIDSSGEAVVIFSRTAAADDDVALKDKIIKWGKVTISDGENEVVLTGGPNKKFMPPYRYYTHELKPQPGRLYIVTAQYRDYKVSAVCRMPVPVDINRIEFKPSPDNDSIRSATLYFTAPQDTPAWFMVTYKEGVRAQAFPCMMSAIEVLNPGEEVALPLFQPKTSLNHSSYSSQFKAGMEGTVSLCRITPEVYRFWRSYFDMMMFSHVQFIGNSESLVGNVSGGLGIWSAHGSSSKFVSVE